MLADYTNVNLPATCFISFPYVVATVAPDDGWSRLTCPLVGCGNGLDLVHVSLIVCSPVIHLRHSGTNVGEQANLWLQAEPR